MYRELFSRETSTRKTTTKTRC